MSTPTTIYTLTIDYRKDSDGNAGVLSTHKTREGAIGALRRHVYEYHSPQTTERHAAELAEGHFGTEDKTVQIVETELED